MLKQSLFLALIALWGLGPGDAMRIASEVEDDQSTNAISKNVNELRFLFYTTPENVVEIDFNNRNSLGAANIRGDLPLVVTIDGFLSNSTSPMTSLLRQSYTAHGGFNLIVLDWSKLSGSESRVDNPLLLAGAYLTVLENVGPVGNRLSEFLEQVRDDKNIAFSDMTLVGGSLGAHIAGAAGAALRRKYGSPQIGRIVGLDPAGPFFSMQVDKDKRLHRGDAVFVEIYHSNRGSLGDKDHDTGDVNVYVNGGDNQPGCAEADQANSGVCSHQYGFKLFNKAFNGNIKACPCVGDAACTCNTCSYDCANPMTIGPNFPHGASGRYHVTHGEIP